jgi:hypothetical protein
MPILDRGEPIPGVGTVYTEDEIREAEEFMRITQLDSNDTRNPNISEMLRLMKVITYESRRAFLQNGCKVDASVFLNKYPRLKDMPEAVIFLLCMWIIYIKM